MGRHARPLSPFLSPAHLDDVDRPDFRRAVLQAAEASGDLAPGRRLGRRRHFKRRRLRRPRFDCRRRRNRWFSVRRPSRQEAALCCPYRASEGHREMRGVLPKENTAQELLNSREGAAG